MVTRSIDVFGSSARNSSHPSEWARRAATAVGERVTDFLEDPIAHAVSKRVIDPLEQIDIGENDRQRRSRSACP
jgi:hypothetical protein